MKSGATASLTAQHAGISKKFLIALEHEVRMSTTNIARINLSEVRLQS